MKKRTATADRATVDEGLVYFTKDQIGEKRALTQDGFLLCRDVPIARTGLMLYGEGESPIEVGPDGLARVTRGEADLLSPEAIASFNGKPVTFEHPPEREVTPANAQRYTVGTILNPRRGEDEYKDCIVADLLITDKRAIAAVNDAQQPTREVSAGYEAGYEQDEPGVGRQVEIRGNHAALVKRGRCGPRCAINDHATQEGAQMGTRVKVNDRRPRVQLAPHVKKAFADAEAAALEAMGLSPDGSPADSGSMDDDETGGGDGHTHIHLHMGGDTPPAAATQDEPTPGGDPAAGAGGDLETRVAGLESSVAKILSILQGGGDDDGAGDQPPAAAATKDEVQGGADDDDPTKVADAAAKAKKPATTADSAALENDFQATFALCEVLVPGFRAPVFDKALERKKTVDQMCGMRRKALSLAMATDDGLQLVAKVHGSEPDVDTMPCAELATLFKAAAGAKSLLTSRSTTDSARTPPPGAFKTVGKATDTGRPAAPRTIAELNAFNAKLYGNKA